MATYMEVVPAYGRDYKNKGAAIADWKAGKDFRDTVTGRYLSIRDITGLTKVLIRYDRNLKVTNV